MLYHLHQTAKQTLNVTLHLIAKSLFLKNITETFVMSFRNSIIILWVISRPTFNERFVCSLQLLHKLRNTLRNHAYLTCRVGSNLFLIYIHLCNVSFSISLINSVACNRYTKPIIQIVVWDDIVCTENGPWVIQIIPLMYNFVLINLEVALPLRKN